MIPLSGKFALPSSVYFRSPNICRLFLYILVRLTIILELVGACLHELSRSFLLFFFLLLTFIHGPITLVICLARQSSAGVVVSILYKPAAFGHDAELSAFFSFDCLPHWRLIRTPVALRPKTYITIPAWQ